jgi:CheY-like chemotaxis protein
MLEDAGYRVTEASSGDTAIAILRDTPDQFVVLLDLIMPGVDGADVLAAISADVHLAARHEWILVTAASNRDLAAVIQLAVDVGALIVHKPFDMDVLLEAVVTAIDRQGIYSSDTQDTSP